VRVWIWGRGEGPGVRRRPAEAGGGGLRPHELTPPLLPFIFLLLLAACHGPACMHAMGK